MDIHETDRLIVKKATGLRKRKNARKSPMVSYISGIQDADNKPYSNSELCRRDLRQRQSSANQGGKRNIEPLLGRLIRRVRMSV